MSEKKEFTELLEVHCDAQGRITLPKAIREEYGTKFLRIKRSDSFSLIPLVPPRKKKP